jgi:hypothetical protein
MAKSAAKIRRHLFGIETLESRRLRLATGPRRMEYLDRGVVATRASPEVA